jgi:hypothetical protein
LAAAFIVLTFLVFPASAAGGWTGLETNVSARGAYSPWDLQGEGGYTGIYEINNRFMLQEQAGGFDTELHLLAGVVGASHETALGFLDPDSPFRPLDLEMSWQEDENPRGFAELDRLWLSFSIGGADLTVGRQAVTWGDAYFYNISDLFGAYAPTDSVRLHKAGIDSLHMALPTGDLTSLEAVMVPASDEHDGSAAVNLLLTAGSGMVSLTGGSVAGEPVLGAGYTVDLTGTRYYLAFTSTDTDSDRLFQATAGAERQLGEWTHFLGELYYNSWGTDDPGKYPLLLTDDRLLSGRVFTPGKSAAAIQLSRQLTALVSGRTALFANLSDGSVLWRTDATYSFSDLTDVWGGLSLGLGERADALELKSEHGAVPMRFYLEIVHNLG